MSQVRAIGVGLFAGREPRLKARAPEHGALGWYTEMSEPQAAGEAAVKRAPALSWADVGSREAALVRLCAAGDEGACAQLVETHQRMVFHLAWHLLGDQDEALDLSQDVFLSVFRTIGRFRGQSALRTWIYRIVINQARNRHRWWRRRHRGDQVSLDEHLAKHGDFPALTDAAAPDRVLGRKEQAARLWAALGRLPFEQRTAVVLREIDGLSYEEIAGSLGVAVGTVKSRLTRAREALRNQLKEARAS
jgi:RNA polymerase sigma-70 factor (ECF subfamily)